MGTWSTGHVRSDLLAFTGAYLDRAHEADLYENWSIGALSASRADLYADAARAEMGAAIVARGRDRTPLRPRRRRRGTGR